MGQVAALGRWNRLYNQVFGSLTFLIICLCLLFLITIPKNQAFPEKSLNAHLTKIILNASSMLFRLMIGRLVGLE